VNSRMAFCFSGGALVCLMLAISLLWPLQDAYVMNLGSRLVPPNSTYLFGTDEFGRDVYSRFLAGSRYTILTGFLTTLLAGASGYLLGNGARAKPEWLGRLVTILAYMCFVVPSFMLAPRWPNRLLATALCLFAILPLFIIALVVVSVGELTGWMTSLALGPLWGIGIAYVLYKDRSLKAVAALMASVFAWAVCLHAALDVLGLGVQPPEPSWGSMLVVRNISWWPQATAAFGFLTVGVFAFSLSDLASRKS
jgi:peptide/nickel transport system permease protein